MIEPSLVLLPPSQQHTLVLPAYWQQSVQNLLGQLSPSSRRVYHHGAQVFLEWLAIQGLASSEGLASLDREQCIAYRDHCQEIYAKATASRMLVTASRLLREMVILGVLERNPMEYIRRFQVENTSPYRALTEIEVKALLKLPDRETRKGLRDYALLLILVKTGMRRAECAALTVGDLGYDQGYAIATIRHGKGDKRRVVKLMPEVLHALKGYMEGTGRSSLSPAHPLFCQFHDGDLVIEEALSASGIRYIIDAYGAQMELDISPHNLRATFVTLTLERGAPLDIVQEAAGHSKPETTKRYKDKRNFLQHNAADYLQGIS